jgi:hypothetical protein
MTEDANQSGPTGDQASEDRTDSSWQLPELAPVAILVSVGLMMLSGIIAGWLETKAEFGVAPHAGWAVVQVATRWVDPMTAALLLSALAVCWWQYSQWAKAPVGDASNSAALAHVGRVRVLTVWLQAFFFVTIVASLANFIATVIISGASDSGIASYVWSIDISSALYSLAVISIAAFGLIAGRRVANAASTYVSTGSEVLD